MHEPVSPIKPGYRLYVFAAFILILVLASVELFTVAWGSGNWLGQLSSKWVLALAGFAAVVLALALGSYGLLWEHPRVTAWRKTLVPYKTRLNSLRWLLALLLAALPAWLFAYSPLSLILSGLFLRFLIFLLVVSATATLLTRSEEQLISLNAVLQSAVLTGSIFVIAKALTQVTDYPFSLYWSEGNRFWDYSILYGKRLYNYYCCTPIQPVWIDRGRQALWGMPFLFPNPTILGVRLWSALLFTVPYAFLGWMLFRPLKGFRWQWFLIGLWVMIFLDQGPIYTPLALSAILVAGARHKPFWIALPLVFVAGYYADLTRFTWMFAPAMWAVMFVFADAPQGKIGWWEWSKAIAFSIAGTWTGGIPFLIGVIKDILPEQISGPAVEISEAAVAQGQVAISTPGVAPIILQAQPYVWSRLLPNPIYSPGILLGLAFAGLPLVILLVLLVYRQDWRLNYLQMLAIGGPLIAFLIVGVATSAKVGGGTNLHNLDMFMIALLFVAAFAWEKGFHERLKSLSGSPWLKSLLVAIVLVPAFTPMISARPLNLPPPEKVEGALSAIRESVSCANQHGAVLFMDQRQLLTFGTVESVFLHPEYEKKYVMDQALAANTEYFEEFYTRLEAAEYSLIIMDRQSVQIKDDGKLDVENNVWVEWVTRPLLEHYESIQNYKQVGVEMFAPIGRTYDCPIYGE